METKISSVQTQKSLSVVQFISSNIDTFDYVSLGNALANNFIEIKEVGEGARVNDLFVYNNSDKFVFMMDGDIIEGAKQNRVINTSILLAPQCKTQIQVSCVERGRWRYVSDKFNSSVLFAPSFLRSAKSRDVHSNLREGRSHYADQGKVWDDVKLYCKKFNVESETENLGAVYEANKETFEKAQAEFKYNENVNGIAIFIDGKIITLDLFNSSKVYQDYFGKIIKGAFFEINHHKKTTNEINESELKYKTLEVIDKIETLEKNTFNGVGVGIEKRFETKEFVGLELMFNDLLIHQSVIKIN